MPPGLFDHDIRPDQARAFLADPGHILLLACDGPLVVGMATASVLLHPDKPPALFVNEVGTRDSHLRQGVATALMQHLLTLARARGCQGSGLAPNQTTNPPLAFTATCAATRCPSSALAGTMPSDP